MFYIPHINVIEVKSYFGLTSTDRPTRNNTWTPLRPRAGSWRGLGLIVWPVTVGSTPERLSFNDAFVTCSLYDDVITIVTVFSSNWYEGYCNRCVRDKKNKTNKVTLHFKSTSPVSSPERCVFQTTVCIFLFALYLYIYYHLTSGVNIFLFSIFFAVFKQLN